MWRKSLFLACLLFMLILVGSASAATTLLRCDIGLSEEMSTNLGRPFNLKPGWTLITKGTFYKCDTLDTCYHGPHHAVTYTDVAGTGIDIVIDTSRGDALEGRDRYAEYPDAEPLAIDYYKADDTGPGEGDMILTFRNLASGDYVLRSYHNNPAAEGSIALIDSVVASGAVSGWVGDCNIPITGELADANVGTGLIRFTANGTGEVTITYVGSQEEGYTGDPPLNAFELTLEALAGIVDDFESYCQYGCGDEIYNTWLDGIANDTGSWIALGIEPTDPVRGGKQSMEYEYNNSSDYGPGYYSETEADTAKLEIGPDWTVLDVKALTLYFYGNPGNDAGATEQMYVGLEDSIGAGSYTEVRYGDNGEDMNDIKIAEWQDWNIALQDFNDGGVSLADVNKVYIGFGARGSQVAGGQGTVYFDDIRLYPVRCIPEAAPIADLTTNCVVDFDDFAILGDQWLQPPGSPSADIAPEPPDGLVDTLDLAVLADGWLVDEMWPAQ